MKLSRRQNVILLTKLFSFSVVNKIYLIVFSLFFIQFTFLFERLCFFELKEALKKLSIFIYVKRVSLLPLCPCGLFFVLPLIDIQ